MASEEFGRSMAPFPGEINNPLHCEMKLAHFHHSRLHSGLRGLRKSPRFLIKDLFFFFCENNSNGLGVGERKYNYWKKNLLRFFFLSFELMLLRW
ncbi:hypothetical protein CEXT_538731 [Caerostris extrusa]|uniref:Uncharacterized protein n=1 Tax=Caerostris extrusa TaxID=172846 RepID=A0AAV4Y3X5_CAEEX|nr:hypothetical protein CEXT_538731 [Caerostris extrusa]